MQKLMLVTFFAICMFSCQQQEEERYTPNSVTYQLFQSSDFEYDGTAVVRELKGGGVEVTLSLRGPKSNDPYYFPSHLHFGNYKESGAALAFLLNPVDIKTLESKTILGKLSDGTDLNFESFRNFDGHIKVHLANEGPDYDVILATGNVGKNDNSIEQFSRESISACTPYFPN